MADKSELAALYDEAMAELEARLAEEEVPETYLNEDEE